MESLYWPLWDGPSLIWRGRPSCNRVQFAVLDEFCPLLLSARLCSVDDALLDVTKRLSCNKFLDDENVRRCKNPSGQEQSATCYAHVIAAVICMALGRIVGREGGQPSIEDVRERILQDLPPTEGEYVTEDVLGAAVGWYRPLQFREMDEDGARQAVLRRRPVLSVFSLSESGWDEFSIHFEDRSALDRKQDLVGMLTLAGMAEHRSSPRSGGHAVVLTGCSPRSLTFLNAWGREGGNDGCFSVENPSVLELDGSSGSHRMDFYDVYWTEAS